MEWEWVADEGSGDFSKIHEHVVRNLADGSVFVELGVASGHGLATLIRAADNVGRKIRVVGVDFFGWNLAGRVLDKEYIKSYLNSCGISPSRYELIEGDTSTTASQFARVDYVFVDASHDENSVFHDIHAWLPTIPVGGYIGGHDYNMESVKAAVHRFFPAPQVFPSNCWLSRKEG